MEGREAAEAVLPPWPVKILVLGNSGTSGQLTGGTSWTRVFGDCISEQRGTPVHEEQSAFVPTGSRAPEIAAKSVADSEPDLVIVPVSNYVFSAKFVWVRIQRLLGRRAGRWFRGIEQSFNDQTYDKGRLRHRLNMTLRKVAHRLVGAEALTTSKECAKTYADTFQRLAQAEDVEVVVVSHGGRRSVYRDPELLRERTLHLEEVRASAEAHHLLFVNTSSVSGQPVGSGDGVQADGLHVTAEYQRAMGEFVAEAYLKHVTE